MQRKHYFLAEDEASSADKSLEWGFCLVVKAERFGGRPVGWLAGVAPLRRYDEGLLSVRIPPVVYETLEEQCGSSSGRVILAAGFPATARNRHNEMKFPKEIEGKKSNKEKGRVFRVEWSERCAGRKADDGERRLSVVPRQASGRTASACECQRAASPLDMVLRVVT